uniref:Uncharacterized protein n=1 Tax=Noccaea caerulescens TaxID=107243 RepID=A0A1J3F6G9_NOCCA
MQATRVIVCGLSAKGIIPPLHQNTQQAEGPLHQNTQQANDNQGRRHIICGLPAKGMFPQLHQQPRQEADDDQGSDIEELTKIQYRRAMRAKGYLIRIEEDEEDIDPIYLRALKNMRNNARNSAQLKRPKQEQGESSRGKDHRRD